MPRLPLLLPLLLALSLTAQAQPQQPPAPSPTQPADEGEDDVAKKQFLTARKLYEDGDYSVALPLFQEALRRSDSPNARLYVARCLRGLGRVAEAYNEMLHTSADATRLAAMDSKYEPTRDAADKALESMRQEVGRVIVQLPSQHSGAVISLGDRQIDHDELAHEIAVEPGEVKVVASQDGFEPFQTTLTVEAGSSATVVVTLAAKELPTPAPPAPIVEPDDDEGLSTLQIAGLGVAGLGVAGLVVMGVTGAMAQDKRSQLEDECGGARCTDPSTAEVVDDGKTLRLVANVSLAAGATCVVAGALMFVFGMSGEDEAPQAALAPVPGGGMAFYQGRF